MKYSFLFVSLSLWNTLALSEDPALRRRAAVDGYSSADIFDYGVQTAASFVVQALIQQRPNLSFNLTGSSNDYVPWVSLALQQVVAGTNYKLNLGITDTSGKCVGIVEQVVVYNRFGNLSVTNWGDSTQCGSSGNVAGDFLLADVASLYVQNAAKFTVQQLFQQQPSYYSFDLTSANKNDYTWIVKRAWREVVAGYNYRLTIALIDAGGNCAGSFEAIVNERWSGVLSVTTWLNEVSCDVYGGVVEKTQRVYVGTPNVQTAASFAALQLFKQPTTYSFSVVPNKQYYWIVLEASQEEVAGIDYNVTVEVGDPSIGPCIGRFVAIVHSSTEGSLSLAKWGDEVSCGPDGQLPGDYQRVYVRDPAVVNAAYAASDDLAQHITHYSFSLMPGRSFTWMVLVAWRQVVSGTNYKLIMEIADDARIYIGRFEVIVSYDSSGKLTAVNFGPEV